MSTAVRRGIFFGATVREGDALPVIVKDKDGNINKKETNRINANNAFFKQAQENNAFSLGKLENAITKLTSRTVGTGEAASIVSAAEKVSKADADKKKKKKAKGGYVKKYAKGGGIRKAQTYG